MLGAVLNGIAAQFKENLGGKSSGATVMTVSIKKIILACPGQFIERDIPHLGICKIHGLNGYIADGLARD